MMNKLQLCMMMLLVAATGAFMIPSTRQGSSQATSTTATPQTALFGVSDRLVMMPATIVEKETTVQRGATGPAVLERPTTTDRKPTKEKQQHTADESWEVRIYNDGMNTREHVARSLVQVTGVSELCAYQTMMQAHQNGIATVGRWQLEIAEVYQNGLEQQGIISDMVPVEEEK